MNGKKLTKKQISKINKIEKLFNDLSKQDVKPLLYCNNLTFWRYANLDSNVLFDDLANGNATYQDTKIKFKSIEP